VQRGTSIDLSGAQVLQRSAPGAFADAMPVGEAVTIAALAGHVFFLKMHTA